MVLPSRWTSAHNNMQKTLQVLCGIRIGVVARQIKKEEEQSRITSLGVRSQQSVAAGCRIGLSGLVTRMHTWASGMQGEIRYASWQDKAFQLTAEGKTPPNGGFSLHLSLTLSLSLSLIQHKEVSGSE